MDEARRYRVSGMVQGVGFRFFVERGARKLRLDGYVKNLRDGRVEVFVMGPAPQLAELKRQLEAGPPAARVTGVEQEAANVDERYRGHFTVEFEGGLW